MLPSASGHGSNYARRPLFAISLSILLLLQLIPLTPTSFALTNNGSITALGVPLTENFNSLASTGTNLAWADNSTLPGWYSSRTTYTANNGNSGTGSLYSYGTDADRALGNVGSNTTGEVLAGVRLVNNTGSTIGSLDISYFGEQWRNGGNTTPQTVDFQYQVTSAAGLPNISSGTWTDYDPLDFTSIVNTATAATLDGNNPANRISISATLNVSVPNGQQVWLRWRDPNQAGNDHGMAVDDFSVVAHAAVVPTDPTGVGSATPGTVLAGGSTLLKVAVTPGANPTSTGLAVTADLTPIGGSGAQQFFDDGVNGGDENAGDKIFSFQATVATGTTPGAKTLSAAITDAQSRSNTANINLTVKSPPSTTIVISEVDADPPLSGTDTVNEWFELQNVSGSAITLTNWTISDNIGTDTLPTVTIGPGGHAIVAGTSAGFASEHPGFAGTVIAISDGGIGNGLGNGGDRLVLKDGNGVEVDAVSWGSDIVAFNPSAPAANAANTIQRDAAGTDTDTAADWTSAAPTPDGNTNTGSINPAGVGSANPNSVSEGNTTLLRVAVTPGSAPPSTSLAVTADLNAIGGSATQQFYDDGTNGDAAAGDNTFSFLATVAIGTPLGPKNMPAIITDAESRFGNANIPLTVAPPPPPPIGISQIQGNGAASPYAGQVVTTNGIVTARKSNGFFLQTQDGADDGNASTSEGIFVFTSSNPTVTVGDYVTVSGTAVEFFNLTEIGGSPSITVHSNDNPLPAAITLTTSILNSAGTLDQLERFEGMRLHADALVSVAPTNEFAETFTVLEGVGRPFREPGIEISHALPPGAPASVPRFDENPERIMIDSDGLQGSAPIVVTSGVTFTNVTGPLDFAFGDYKIVPEAPPSLTPNANATPVPAASADEFTIGSINLENFYASESNFSTKLSKASLAIRNVMRSPDIIGTEEVGDITTLTALANRLNLDTVGAGFPNPGYQAFLIETDADAEKDIDVGFLVKTSRVVVDSVTQEGEDATYINPANNQAELLNDRAPLILRAKVQRPNASAFPVTVIVNHLRSLIDIEQDPGEGPRVRAKRRAQAEYLANLVQSLQNEYLVLVGDFNAFQFNDGYVDVIGTIRGVPTPADQVVLASPDLVNPDLIDLVDTLTAEQRYSFSFGGHAQVLDHVLVDPDMFARLSRFAYARNNADFPETLFSNDASRPERVSDHDMPVAYFTFPPPAADLSLTKSASSSSVATGSDVTYTITVTNNSQDPAQSVVVTDALPAGTTFVSCNATGGGVCGGTGNNRTVSYSSLPAGESRTITLVATVNCAVANNTVITNTATVNSDTNDPDSDNNSGSASITASNPAPTITGVGVDKPVLSPPNHKMVDVTVSYNVTDNCGDVATSLSVSSNEAVNGTGDGDTAPDWEVVDAHHVRLRAERSGNGNGRIYTITITATDSAGNTSSQTVNVSVPKGSN